MLDHRQSLRRTLRLGERSALECEDVRTVGGRVRSPELEHLADTLAAFANAGGGTFLLGVERQTSQVLGIPLERLDSVTELVRDVCTESIQPPLEQMLLDRLWMSSATGEVRAVIRVDVPHSLFVHESPTGCLHWLGDSPRQMSPESLARLFEQRRQTPLIRFDQQVVAHARIEDLSRDLIDTPPLRPPASEVGTTEFLGKLGVVRKDRDGILKPTVTGVLMASEGPRRWLPNAYIRAIAYRDAGVGSSSAGPQTQIDSEDLTGPLPRQIIEACRFVARNVRRSRNERALGSYPRYDITAVLEAIVNAVVHRDYSLYGGKIDLRLFDDRLEICSPGAIPGSLTIDSLPHRQYTRNEAICSLLGRWPVPDEPWLTTTRRNMMEARGEGVTTILENSTKLSGRVPEYRLLDETELLLTIYGAEL